MLFCMNSMKISYKNVLYVGPISFPKNVSAMAITPTNISVQWEPVEEINENGIIIAYEVTYSPQETFAGAIKEMSVNVSGMFLSTSIGELEEFVNYTVSVVAYTAVGGGPSSTDVSLRTLQSGKCKCVRVTFDSCTFVNNNLLSTVTKIYFL